MAKTAPEEEEIVVAPANSVIETSISAEMEKSYLDYAMSVIVARALPDCRDGLKPVHRRVIYAAHEQGMHYGTRYQKCAAVVGEVLKKYHPHGDIAVYDALVRMGQDFSLRYTLIDGQGNFGSIDGDAPAAMRYTECRLDKLSDALLTDIDKDTVKFIPNYSGDYLEPEVLPSTVPNLLLNGASGIAVGMATNIPPHNLGEVVDALIYALENPDEVVKSKELPNYESLGDFATAADTSELVKFIKGPDFPTGGHIYDKKEIANVYATGRGRVLMRGTANIEEGKKGFQIIITEIPYMVNKSDLVARIADMVKEKKIDGIADLRDESNRIGMRIAVDLKRDGNPQLVLNQLFKHTALQSTFNANIVALVNGEPKTMTLKMILQEFVKHRQVVVWRRTRYLLAAARAREHILQGLKIALDHLDEVIKTIRNAADADEAKAELIKKFGLDDIQATAILDMQLRRLAALERQKIEDELKSILKTIADLTALLESRVKILETVKKELLEVREKYGDARKTKYHAGGVGEFELEDLVPQMTVIVTMTKDGYLKRLPEDAYRKQGRGGKGVSNGSLKEEDQVDTMLVCNTHDNVFFFTNRGKIYQKRAWDIPEGSRTARGSNAVNLLAIEQGEKILSILPIPNQSTDEKSNIAPIEPIIPIRPKYIFLTTEQGTVKKTGLDEFENIRKGGITAIKLDDGDSLAWANTTTGNDEIMLVTAEGKSIRFSEKDVRPMGRSAAGVRGVRLGVGDKVVGMAVISKDSDQKIFTISERGFGKQTAMTEYGVQNRGGGGIFTAKVTSKTGKLVAALVVDKEATADLLITSKLGQMIRLPAKDIPTLSRTTQGVTLMRFDAEDRVAAVTTC